MPSRVGQSPVQIPSNVEVRINDRTVVIKGKIGELQRTIHPLVTVQQADKVLKVAPINKSIDADALAGTTRALLNNMVVGVSTGFECKLTLVGVGYRAKAQGENLNLTVGFSHPVDMVMPAGISVETPSQTEIVLKSIDVEAVTQMAAKIRAIRPPEPYKGKGIRYANEKISLKEAKKK